MWGERVGWVDIEGKRGSSLKTSEVEISASYERRAHLRLIAVLCGQLL